MPMTIRRLSRLLAREYGESHWWPGDTPFEVIVGAILTQNTSWKNVERAISNLKESELLSPAAIARSRISELERAIRPSGFFRQKARNLKSFAEYVQSTYGGHVDRMRRGDVEQLREELLSLPGIGPETADSILLYALGKPSFVVDSYTRRLLGRLKVPHGGRYEDIKRMFEKSLGTDADMYGEMHALIVIHCKNHCIRSPICRGCPLARDCPSYREQKK